MDTLKIVLKAIIDVLSTQQAQIASLVDSMESDEETERLAEIDFAALQAQIASLMPMPDTLG